MSNNKKVADILNEIAAILELQEVRFKPRAYRNAAMAVESMAEDIKDIAKQGRLDDIPGVGKGIAQKIDEIVKTGHLIYLEKLKKKVPVKVKELMDIEGMGPKTIKKFYKIFGVKSRKELEAIAKKHKIRGLKGFGETAETNILKSIKFAKKTKDRLLLGYVLPEAEAVVQQLKSSGTVKKISLAGSLRRKKSTIGDVDILAVAKNPAGAIDFFTKKIRGLSRVSAKGSTKASIKLKSGLQIDLRILDNKSWGAGLQYFTGSKRHGIHTRQLAFKKGYKLNEYGLFKGKKQMAGSDEKEIYKKLGMQYIEPELREDTGEIEAALKKKIPKLVQIKEIKGDLHVHTKWSDGRYTIKEMADAAKRCGMRYIAITDHTGNLKIAGGLTGKELMSQKAEIKKINQQVRGIRIFSGAEVNIKDSGAVDIPNKYLKRLDVVVASIHSGHRGSKEKLTKRICTAMENPYVHIIGHPTGRILQKREAYALNFDKICETAKKTGTALEINAYPNRLDLSEELIRTALKKGVKLAIGTDAHSIEHCRFIKIGGCHARKGWCRKGELANTRNAAKILRWLRKKNKLY